MPFISRISALAMVSVLAVACDKEPASQQLVSENNAKAVAEKVMPVRKVEKASEQLVKSAYLREVLPDSAYAYVRYPNLWAYLGTNTGGALDNALGSQSYTTAVRSVQQGFGTDVIPELPKETQAIAKLFLHHAVSPVEAMVMSPADKANPLPKVLMTAALDLKSTEVGALLQKVAAEVNEVELLSALDAEGKGMLSIAGLPAQVQWDSTMSRLFIQAGGSAKDMGLTEFLTTLGSNADHPMMALESGIDTSGKGLFAWVNPRKLMELAKAFGAEQEIAPLAVLGVNFMKNIAVGVGTSNGMGRIKLVVDMPQAGFRGFLPVIRDTPNFKLAGKVGGIAVLGLPSTSDFITIESSVAAMTPSEDMKEYYAFKKEFSKKLGFRVEDIFSMLGQDVSYVNDEAGSYVVVRLKDAEKFQSMIDKSVENFDLKYRQKEISGHRYHHLSTPSVNSVSYAMAEQESMNAGSPLEMKLLKRFMGTSMHIYWEQEGDYLVIADIPQTLMDRHYIKQQTSADQWLKKQQRISPEGALLMGTARTEGLPAMMYRMQLAMLAKAGDMVGRPVDLFDIPTVREANLPKDGAYGAKVTSSNSQMAFELSYASHPAEILLGGNSMEKVAIVGILAAIALPAYQDYMARAEVQSSISASNDVRRDIEVFVEEFERFPTAAELVDYEKAGIVTDQYSLDVQADDGVIRLAVSNKSLRENNEVFLVPEMKEDGIIWNCETGMPKKYLPASCR